MAQKTAVGVCGGQSYEHQSHGGSDSADTDWARYSSAVRSGARITLERPY